MNVVTEMHSMLFLNEKAFVKLRSHDGRSPTINVGTQSPHRPSGASGTKRDDEQGGRSHDDGSRIGVRDDV